MTQQKRMPVLFIGHGSPMNIIEKNQWTESWRVLGEKIGKVDGIVMLSAHWYTDGTFVTEEPQPKMIYDMYGFPAEIYEYVYPAINAEPIRDLTLESLDNIGELNHEWGYDHGNYGVLSHLFPDANIPVLQVSINRNESSQYHYEIGQKLKQLRDQNILIVASGNIVHNLRRIMQPQATPWAKNFDHDVAELTKARDIAGLIALETTHPDFKLAAPTPDHFYPFLSALGATDENDNLTIMNQDVTLETLTMTSYIWGDVA